MSVMKFIGRIPTKIRTDISCIPDAKREKETEREREGAGGDRE